MREFSGRVAVIATMHRKEQAIAPVLSPLGVTAQVPLSFDTDRFGTFTRDVPRIADQLATARTKAQAALELTGETLAIASEGSFGPHPQMPMLPCNRELVLLVDQELGIEVVGQALSTETNHRAKRVRTVTEALSFAHTVNFPSHALVVMPAAKGATTGITKGITREAALEEAIALALTHSSTGRVHVETDMRAMHNPSRMAVIAQATDDLMTTLQRRCPDCHCPGFSVAQRRPGLPCELCHSPTLLTLSLRYQCQRCSATQERYVEEKYADPTHCPFCNP
ncbi:MAG: DUF6671 family protein [Cyanobacteria bacterium P01_A01_bin.135]